MFFGAIKQIVGLFLAVYLIANVADSAGIDNQPVHQFLEIYENFLPGWLVGGIGVGLAFPTIIAAATADLPAERTSTGSAIVSMSRQIGIVLGVSGFVAVLGVPHGFDAVYDGFRHAWWAIVSVSALAAVSAVRMTPSRSR